MPINKFTSHKTFGTDDVLIYPAGDIDGEKIIEIGPGRGDFLFHLAEIHPEKVIYGIEIKGLRFDKLVARRDKRKLNNIRLVMADAKFAVPKLFEKNSVDTIYINFPDPWPKSRHANRRLLQKEFLELLTSVLKKDGHLFFTTDAEFYAKDVHQLLNEIPQLRSEYNGIKNESDEAFPTYFSEKWKKEGRTIYYQKYIKTR